jgi:hypothetical protein
MSKAIKFILANAFLLFATSLVSADLLTNGDFEADPVLGNGQTNLAVGQLKRIETDLNHSSYSSFIAGVQDWSSPFQNGSTGIDNGLAKVENIISGGSGDFNNQQLFLNTWNSWAFQEIDRSLLQSGDNLRASVDFGTIELADSRGGWLGLWSDVNNGYVDSVLIGNDDWTASSLDFSVGDREFGNAFLDYTVTSVDLTDRFYYVLGLQNNSRGTMFFDNASLTITSVPEPMFGTLITLGFLGFVSRRNRIV